MPRSPITHPIKITQRYLANPKNYPYTGGHSGVDIRSPLLDDWVACVVGVFHAIDYKDAWGRWTQYGAAVAIDQGQADGSVIRFLYGHGANRRKELENRHVAEGQFLCDSGNTGTSTAAHLHFELRHYPRDGSGRYYDSKVKRKYNLLDPTKWLAANKIPYTFV